MVPFVDGSPRHNRRYCSDTCATRTRVRRHRRNADSS
ncbi:CGNR zinc finger domain-containing protein [Saxibacter everestensis]